MKHAPTGRGPSRSTALLALCVVALAGPISRAVADPEERILAAVTGTYSDGERTLRLAAMPCGGHELCLYVEMVERGREEFPLRQQVWALDNLSDAGADAMLLGFPPSGRGIFSTDLADAAVALWAAPLAFPTIDLDALVPLGVSSLAIDAAGWSLDAGEMTIHRAGGRRMDLAVRSAGSVSWRDEILGGSGERISGVDATLARIEEPTTVRTTESGLVIIDLRVGPGLELEAGDSALIHYSVWRGNGQLADSSRTREKPEHLQPAPGPFFAGMREGVLGMFAGERQVDEAQRHRRRLVVPPNLAFDSRGLRPVIGPDEPLIVDLELITLRKMRR